MSHYFTTDKLKESGLQLVIMPGGVVNVTTNNDFGGVKIDANQSAFAVGSNNQVSNSVTNHIPEVEKLFENMLGEINEKLGGQDRLDAENDTKAISEAVKVGNLDRAKRIYSTLADGIRTFASVIAIGRHFNWL